jgi:hypothetical protein
MISIKPHIPGKYICSCGGEYHFSELLWQGLHVCEKLICNTCKKIRINSLPVNQSAIEQYSYYPDSGLICDLNGTIVPENWFSKKLKSLSDPVYENVEIEIEKISGFKDVLVLNTLDYVYGHSLLYLLNLQRIIRSEKSKGIIVIIQPMLKWLVPKEGVAEIWTVNLGFRKFNNYYPALSERINSEFDRFQTVCLSTGHIIPTNENTDIENFTQTRPYDFKNEPDKPGITFIWREDPDRLWIRNIYLLKGFKKLGFRRVLIPIQYLRVLFLFKLLRIRLGNNFTYSLAGLGKFGRFPSVIQDYRVESYDEDTERRLCAIFAGSKLVFGVHGSSMLLPSAHAGMTLSLMPSKRWGNFGEDILFSENDPRIAAFQKRIVPLNLCICEIRDIISDMITGRDQFVKKFLHSEEL